jgi:phospholipid transport system substrate-binding protein
MVLYVLMLAATALHATEQYSSAQELVEAKSKLLVDGLIEYRDRIKTDRSIADDLVARHVLPYIDFERVARLVLGKYWRQANDDQRKRFSDEFAQFLTNSYTTAMVEFSDEIVSHAKNVRYLPQVQHEPEYATVRMEIAFPDRPPVQVNYSLYLTGNNGWQIYDLAIEGVSLATTYRSTFATTIRRGSIDDLIQQLADKNAANRAGYAAAEAAAAGSATNQQ